jgi:hypothetical protein
MLMEEFEYYSLLGQLNEKKKSYFMMLCIENNLTSIHLYAYFLQGVIKMVKLLH